MALIAGGVTSVVASLAMGADPAAVGTWFWGVVDGLVNRIQAGYAINRQSAMQYLQRHAVMNGARVVPQPGSLDVGALRKRLEITGPVGFKSAIAAGQSPQEALRHMSTRMSGVADETVRNGDRDVITQTAINGQGVIGWRRRLSGRACGFCSMLASRGAVYVNRRTAMIAKDGARYHEHCHCYAEPLYFHERHEPLEVRELQRQWNRVTAGHSGPDAARVWRRHWERRHAAPAQRARTFTGPADPNKLTVAQLRANAADFGLAVPSSVRKPALVRLAQDLDAGVDPQVALARATSAAPVKAAKKAAAKAAKKAAPVKKAPAPPVPSRMSNAALKTELERAGVTGIPPRASKATLVDEVTALRAGAKPADITARLAPEVARPSTVMGPRAARLGRVDNPADIRAQALATNPRYGQAYHGPLTPQIERAGGVTYAQNCTRVVIAHEMRRRGLRVTAGAGTSLGDTTAAYLRTFRSEGRYATRLLDDLNRNMSARQVAAEVESWPRGARGIVTIKGHTLNVERDVATGRAVFIDAQAAVKKNPVMNLSQFQTRVRQRGAPTERWMAVTRVDDLDLSDYGLHYVEADELDIADGRVLKSEFPQDPDSDHFSTEAEMLAMTPDDTYPGAGSGGTGRADGDVLRGEGPTYSAGAPPLRQLLDDFDDFDITVPNRQVRAAVQGEYPGGLRVEVDGVSSGTFRDERYLAIDGVLRNSQGRKVGTFSREIRETADGKLVAEHHLLELDRRMDQGSGFAEAFNENLYDWYRRSGVAEVHLTANIDVGGYAWARKGYDFADAQAAREFLGHATQKVDGALALIERGGRPPRGVTEADLRLLREYLADVQAGRITAHAPDIAGFGRQPGQAGKSAVWSGKWLMLGSSWKGVLRL